MIRSKHVMLGMVWSSLVVLGCSNIRVVEVHPGQSGVVALLGLRDGARTKAEAYMQTQCPGGYDIVGEGEAVVGSRSQGSATAVGGNGFAVGSSSSVSQNINEWRIQYRCKGGPAQGKLQQLVVRL
jgi:hypothetical protein